MDRVKCGAVPSLSLSVHTCSELCSGFVWREAAVASSQGQRGMARTGGCREDQGSSPGVHSAAVTSLVSQLPEASHQGVPTTREKDGSLLPEWPQSQLPFGKCSSLASLSWGLSLGSKMMPEFSYCSCPWLIMPVNHSLPLDTGAAASLQCCGWCTKAAPPGRSLWHNTLLS